MPSDAGSGPRIGDRGDVYLLASSAAKLMPPNIAHALAGVLGGGIHRIWRRRRMLVQRNLVSLRASGRTAAFDADRVCRKLFAHWLVNLNDLFTLPHASETDIERSTTVEGWEHVENALAEGLGLIIASAHAGCYWHLNRIPAIRGIRNTSLVQQDGLESLYSYVRRAQWDRHRYAAANGSLDDFLEILARGEAISLMVDRVLTHAGVTVDFFGRPTRLPFGHAWLAMTSGAPIVICYGRRLGVDRHLLRYHPPLWVALGDQSAGLRRNIMSAVCRVACVLEEEIGKDPSQWLTLCWDQLWKPGGGEP